MKRQVNFNMPYRDLQRLIYLTYSCHDPFQPAQESLPQLFFAIDRPLSIPDNPEYHSILGLPLYVRSRCYQAEFVDILTKTEPLADSW